MVPVAAAGVPPWPARCPGRAPSRGHVDQAGVDPGRQRGGCRGGRRGGRCGHWRGPATYRAVHHHRDQHRGSHDGQHDGDGQDMVTWPPPRGRRTGLVGAGRQQSVMHHGLPGQPLPSGQQPWHPHGRAAVLLSGGPRSLEPGFPGGDLRGRSAEAVRRSIGQGAVRGVARNRYADLLRALAAGGVVYGHWLLISVTYQDRAAGRHRRLGGGLGPARSRRLRAGRTCASACPGHLRRRPGRDPVHRPRSGLRRRTASAAPGRSSAATQGRLKLQQRRRSGRQANGIRTADRSGTARSASIAYMDIDARHGDGCRPRSIRATRSRLAG